MHSSSLVSERQRRHLANLIQIHYTKSSLLIISATCSYIRSCMAIQSGNVAILLHITMKNVHIMMGLHNYIQTLNSTWHVEIIDHGGLLVAAKDNHKDYSRTIKLVMQHVCMHPDVVAVSIAHINDVCLKGHILCSHKSFYISKNMICLQG